MKWLLGIAILFVLVASPCRAQSHCSVEVMQQAAGRVLALQAEIQRIKVGEMEGGVPPAVAGKITQLKDALSDVSDVALTCSKPSIDPTALQQQLANLLDANAPEPPPNTVISNTDHRYDEIVGSYGHNLRVQVSRPPDIAGVLAIQYSINIECGADTMLLVYECQNGRWIPRLRWQSPPLKAISDAFGDFFLTGFLQVLPSTRDGDIQWRVVVAHGTPRCMSRYSGFKFDLLSPAPDPASPQVLWHIERGYSRGGFDPRLKSSGNTFELRVNADCTKFDLTNCFERRVIYRYEVDGDGHVHRLNPIGVNARGFVEEWLSAPWSESEDLSATESAAVLRKVHDNFDPPKKPGDNQFVSHGLGPVRACAAPGVFQIQINSTLEGTVPGKQGGESKPLASNYFHVREVKNGYVMLSAPTEPDSTCNGPNLMPTREE